MRLLHKEKKQRMAEIRTFFKKFFRFHVERNFAQPPSFQNSKNSCIPPKMRVECNSLFRLPFLSTLEKDRENLEERKEDRRPVTIKKLIRNESSHGLTGDRDQRPSGLRRFSDETHHLRFVGSPFATDLP